MPDFQDRAGAIMIEKLDAHMHVWKIARGDYDWLTPELGAIYRDFAIEDVWDEANRTGTSRVILVQAAASMAETEFMLSIADSDSRVAGVVGWVDFEAASGVEDVELFAQKKHIVGLRPMIADRPDADWILDAAHAPVLEAMVEHNMVFDGHARADLITVMATLAQRYPQLEIVLNHGGKPAIESGRLDEWRRDISRLATCGNVSCKLSGLLTEAGSKSDDGSISDVVEHMGDCFGPERLMWGSDWPVLTLAGSYTGWAEQSARLIERLFPAHQAAIWKDNAERIYLGRAGVRIGKA